MSGAQRPKGLVTRAAPAAPAILVLVVAATLAACAIPPRGTTATAVRSIGETGLTLAPPGNRTAGVSSTAAYGLCIRGVASCAGGAPTAIELALATDTGSNMLDPEGSLVWAIEWLAIPCPPSHGGGPFVPSSGDPTPTPRPTTEPRCDEIALVDAVSGSFIFTLTSPHT